MLDIFLNEYVFVSIKKASGGLPEEIFSLGSLEELELSYQGMTAIPSTVGNLVHLRSLTLDHCPLLESLPGQMGELPVLKSIASITIL